MSRGIRWIPARATAGMGQTTPVGNTNEQPAPLADPAMMNKLMYGGLVLAGLALIWALTFGATPDHD